MESDEAKFRTLAERVDIFAGLSAADVQKIVSRGMTIRVQKGETVFHKGTTGNQMYVVLSGNIGVYDGPRRLATLKVGDTFGEMSLLNREPRSATVVALEMSSLFVLSEQVFQKLLTKRVAVQMLLNLSRIMSKRLAASNMQIREMEGR